MMSYFKQQLLLNFLTLFKKQNYLYISSFDLTLKKKQYYSFLYLNYLIENYTYFDFFSPELLTDCQNFLIKKRKKITFNQIFFELKNKLFSINNDSKSLLNLFSIQLHILFEVTLINTINIFKKLLIKKEFIFIIFLKNFKNIINNLNNINWNIIKLQFFKKNLNSNLNHNYKKKLIFLFLNQKYFKNIQIINFKLPLFLDLFRNNITKYFLKIKIFNVLKNDILLNIISSNWRV